MIGDKTFHIPNLEVLLRQGRKLVRSPQCLFQREFPGQPGEQTWSMLGNHGVSFHPTLIVSCILQYSTLFYPAHVLPVYSCETVGVDENQ